MHNVADSHNELPPNRFRFGFGLKALFVVVTILCLAFGYHSIRRQRALEIVANHDRVVDALVRNFTRVPQGAASSTEVGREEDIRNSLLWEGYSQPVNVVMETGSINSTRGKTVTIGISKWLSSSPPSHIAGSLLGHYSNGLDQAGLNMRNGARCGSTQYEVWASPRQDRVVVVDVNVNPDKSLARVRTLFIDSQQLAW